MNVLNFDSQQCEWTRRHMDAYLSNELMVETTGEVLRHLESCPACARELESRMRIRDALRKAAARQLPPEGFREAVHQRLKEAHQRVLWVPPIPAWALALAACVLLLIAGVAGEQWVSFERGRQIIASVLTLGVSDHVRCAIQGHNYPEVANPPDQLRKKLGPQFAGLLAVVEQRLPGFQVLEAHICTVPGSPREYVHFIARGQGTILSVILTKREGGALPAGRFLAARTSGGIDLYKAKLQGMSVAGFETEKYFGFVVSDLNQEEVVQLAASLAPAVRHALSGSLATEKTAAPALLIASVSFAADLGD